MLTDRLKPAIRSKRQGLLPKDVLFYGNACPHTAAHTAETIQKWKFDAMVHLYSSDLTI
jgi:hypothetical protein